MDETTKRIIACLEQGSHMSGEEVGDPDERVLDNTAGRFRRGDLVAIDTRTHVAVPRGVREKILMVMGEGGELYARCAELGLSGESA